MPLTDYECRERERERRRKYRERNREKVREAKRMYRQRNPDKTRTERRRYSRKRMEKERRLRAEFGLQPPKNGSGGLTKGQRAYRKRRERMNVDPAFREEVLSYQREHQREQYQKQRSEPARWAVVKARWRRRDEAMKADPERRARREALARGRPARQRAASGIMRRDPRAVYAIVLKALQRLPDDMRFTVASDMCIDILENKLTVANIPAKAPDYVRAHNRKFDRFKTLSLDAPLPSGKGAYIDLLADPSANEGDLV